ncbi:MAG: FliA/WhiG family RNA polymerase sigma factor [Bacillota bacterium]|jgi:RNA polymerase sigma factor for flagellar operon FliA|nr:FliA/WhiG family RNA polymerase sigma factor [Bacillota bacterium]NLJ02608.1 FliA/WhiG family RNA polymerase sigma factor [Bacillota bacterium]
MLTQDEQQRLDQLWTAYKKNNDQDARNQLLDAYIPLVKYVAGRMAMNLPSSVETGDLESFGFFGLLDALDKFDETRQIKFETYAATRIRGAILDGLRSMDWVPRSVRSKIRMLEKQVYELTNELGRSPSDSEVAAALDLTPERYYELLTEVKGVNLFSLDETIATDKEGDSLKIVDLVIDSDGLPEHKIVETESVEELTAAVESLSEREQLVLALYYHEGLTLKEIGHVLEVSESRVSQIHTKAVMTLRRKLA